MPIPHVPDPYTLGRLLRSLLVDHLVEVDPREEAISTSEDPEDVDGTFYVLDRASGEEYEVSITRLSEANRSLQTARASEDLYTFPCAGCGKRRPKQHLNACFGCYIKGRENNLFCSDRSCLSQHIEHSAECMVIIEHGGVPEELEQEANA